MAGVSVSAFAQSHIMDAPARQKEGKQEGGRQAGRQADDTLPALDMASATWSALSSSALAASSSCTMFWLKRNLSARISTSTSCPRSATSSRVLSDARAPACLCLASRL